MIYLLKFFDLTTFSLILFLREKQQSRFFGTVCSSCWQQARQMIIFQVVFCISSFSRVSGRPDIKMICMFRTGSICKHACNLKKLHVLINICNGGPASTMKLWPVLTELSLLSSMNYIYEEKQQICTQMPSQGG